MSSETILEGGQAKTFESVINDSEESDAKIAKARAYAQRLGTTSASAPQGHAFLNGKHYELDDVGV